MARDKEQPRKRFSKSGHTQHLPRVPHDDPTGAFAAPWHAPDDNTRALRPPAPEAADTDRHATSAYSAGPAELQQLHSDTEAFQHFAAVPTHGTREYEPPATRWTRDPHRPGTPVPGYDPPAPPPGRTPYGEPTYNLPAADGSPGASRQRGVAGAARGVGGAARFVTRKVITASEADGAKESGLTSLIWNQVLSYGTDAMITVALAGTVFFGASSSAQRGNVLLYLLVTVAPFAVVAPGHRPGPRPAAARPALDDGRYRDRDGPSSPSIMAGHPDRTARALSRARSARWCCPRPTAWCAPRRRPGSSHRGMTLTAANSKLTIFGLGVDDRPGRLRRHRSSRAPARTAPD